MKSLVVVALFAAVVLLAGACADDPGFDRSPAWSPDGKRLAFESLRDGNHEIYVMNADGSDQTNLTKNPGSDRSPAWSPDGKRIAFVSFRDSDHEIYVMNADGSDQTNLTKNPASDRSPAWSLDGKRIAFDSDRDGDDEIYVMNADGSDVTRLTDNPVEADEAEHVEGDEQEDGDAGAFAYLEAAPKDQVYLVEMTSFAYAPEALEVTAGDVLEIAVQNVESVPHDFTIDEIDADVHVSYLAGTGQHAHEETQLEADVHFALTEPGTGVVHMKVQEQGEYVFYCSVPGHRDAGMEGTLIVQ